MRDSILSILNAEDFTRGCIAHADNNNPTLRDLTVDPLSPEDAERRVRESPHIPESMYEGEHHEAGSYSFEEAVLRMQLMADYRLIAAGQVCERHRPRIISAWLEPAGKEEET